MIAERHMALSKVASSLFLLLIGIIISSLFIHRQGQKRGMLSNQDRREREAQSQSAKGMDCGCSVSSTRIEQ